MKIVSVIKVIIIAYIGICFIGLLHGVKVDNYFEVGAMLTGLVIFGILFYTITQMNAKPKKEFYQDRDGFTKIGKFPEFKVPTDIPVHHANASELVIKSEVGLEDDRVITCPGCASNEMVWPPHGDGYKCDKCNTGFTVFGNSIYYWN